MKKEPDVYLIGVQEGAHPGGARYPAFRNHLDAPFVGSLLRFRYMWSQWGRRIDELFDRLSWRGNYSLGLLALELSAGVHMLLHRGAVYHSLKGEVDLHFLPLFSRLTGTTLLATFHDTGKELDKRKVDKRLTADLAGVILLCDAQRPYFEKLLPADRIYGVPHGIDTGLFRPPEQLCDDPIVVAVGSYLRDFSTLARAIPLVWEKNPEARFVLIGTRQALPWNPAPRLTDPRVRYVDGVSDSELLREYHAAAAAVVPVLNATANNAVLEGMACGLPVVATEVGGIAEYLGDEAGILCPIGDAEALADGILRVLADRTAARQMGAAGRARALQFDYRVVADQLRQVYAVARRVNRSGSSATESEPAAEAIVELA